MPALKWTADEDSFLVTAVANRGPKWQRVAKDVWTKDPQQVDSYTYITSIFQRRNAFLRLSALLVSFLMRAPCSAVIDGSTFLTPSSRKDPSTRQSRRFSCPARGDIVNGKWKNIAARLQGSACCLHIFTYISCPICVSLRLTLKEGQTNKQVKHEHARLQIGSKFSRDRHALVIMKGIK
jgi:hypothetical protein